MTDEAISDEGATPMSRRAFAGWLGAAGVAGLGIGLGAGTAGAGDAPAIRPVEPQLGPSDERPFGRTGERLFRASGRRPPDRPPNILVILGDDLGWADLSCYGAPSIRTPNLDGLAADGVRFTQGYAGSATCSPTRISLYTGRYPGRLHGGLSEPIGGPDPENGIPSGHPTLASQLQRAGYHTAMIGKWHCGYLPWFSPTRCGWDSFFGNFAGGLDYFSKINYNGDHDLYEGEVEVEDLRYYTEVLTERAVDLVSTRHDRPWLLNLNYTTPHWPWEAPGDKAVSDELTARVRNGEEGVLFHLDGGSLATYRAMVENLDDSVGEVLTALRSSGAADNTVVLFASDNGGERWSCMWPLTGGKGELWEGGIRVPTVLRWPVVLDAGVVSHTPVMSPDWTATLLDLAGATPSKDKPLDGRSLAGYLLRGEEPPKRDLFWRTEEMRALRRGRWKYLGDADGNRLYDVMADPREQVDLAGQHPKVAEDLHGAWEDVNGTLLPYA